MRYLLSLLARHYFFLFFIFLEVIAFIMIINNNRYHSSVMFKASTEISGAISKTFNDITSYFHLRKQNKTLLEENARLRNIFNLPRSAKDYPIHNIDSTFHYIHAKVIDNSTNRRNNYLMLNKGSRDGLEEDMGVISKDGIAGTVIGVSKNFCTVMSVLHQDSKVSAMIKKNNQLANVVWNTSDYKIGMLTDIPSHIELNEGDTIITSGYSFIYPKGLIIGYVENYFSDKNQNLNSATVRFATDFNGIRHVYIIQNTMKDELIRLKEEHQDE